MAKILTGSTLSYGPVLPDPFKTADGSMFFLTAAYTDPVTSPTNSTGVPQARTQGLHIYSFQQDSNVSTLGDQVGQQWKQVSSLKTYVDTAGDTMTGPLVITSPSSSGGALRIVNAAPGIRFTETDQAVNQKEWLAVVDGAYFQIQTRDDAYASAYTAFSVGRAGDGSLNGQKIWTAGNDGAGSTLDADLLDGQHGAYYLDAANQSGIISLARGGTASSTTIPGGIVYGGAGQLGTSIAGTAGQLLQSGGGGAPTWINASALSAASANQLTTARNITLTGNATGSASFNGTADANISVTVVDSNRVGGYLASTAATVNTAVIRDSSGYIFGSYFNSATPNSESSGAQIAQIVTTNGSDGFYRKASLASVVAGIGLSNYVAKSGDSMTGQLNVNGINLIYSTNSINVPGSGTFGSVTTGNVSVSGAGLFGGPVIAFSVITQLAGTNGGANLIRAGAANTGYIEFVAANNVRQGYIGYSTSTGALDGGNINFVMAQASFTGDVVAYASDARLKKNVVVIENAMDKIGTLGGYSYDWDMEKTRRLGFTPRNEHEHGLLAQEVQKVLPDAVCAAPFNEDYLTVKYERLIALLVAGMNEQQAQINALISEVEDLKNQR